MTETEPRQFRSSYRLRLLRKIAAGGMGSVYEGVLYGAMGFEKTVAIKTILETYSANRKFVEMFVGEAQLVADLVHQNICQVYHLGKFGRRYYIAMEFISGVNLKQFADRHQQLRRVVPPQLGTFIISRVCRGLEYAHAKRDKQGLLLNVVHRDVSPRNIMISTEGEVKLTDFGVAKARNLLTVLEGKVRVGNAPYMSPEQAQYQPTDARSDIFSLGVVMFELLTGERLFASRTMGGAVRNVISKEIPPPRALNPEIPAEVERIMLRALQRDVSRRYQTAGEMGYDLEYEIYHRGYGPTIVSLEKHLRAISPRLFHPGTERQRAGLVDSNGSFTVFSTDATGSTTGSGTSRSGAARSATERTPRTSSTVAGRRRRADTASDEVTLPPLMKP
jgi:eukaryotic-like serine/threonine-protein kinase